MNLECLDDIITDNLAIHIDLTNIKSWIDWNTGLTAFSLTKWTGAISDNINLIDFGLTGFDNGRTNIMWSGITIMPQDTLFSMYKIGYNVIHNPTVNETTGVTATTVYLPMSATSATGGSMNYFDLNGGYLHGFFKLKDYNYELFPTRYNYGITIETLLYLYTDSSGIFLMMGARAEDKYNPHFSGESITGISTTTGVTTSLDNYLDAILEKQTIKTSFPSWESKTYTTYSEANPIDNIKNNAIAFLLTEDKHLGYKYIDNNGLIVTNTSHAVINRTGFTWIDITFTPYNLLIDPECDPQRKGKLTFFVNGRSVWTIKDFPEFYFHNFTNDKEKQLGVPYSISWGGGSFGLEHSWHYDYQTYNLYTGQDTTYINSNFFVEADPISTECYTAPTGDTYLSGLTLSADSSTFYTVDPCDPTIHHPYTVMRIEYTDTGSTATTYFIKFNHPISVLSNRDYTVNSSIFSDNFFDINAISKVSILTYGDVDVNIIDEIVYDNNISNINKWKPLKCIFRIDDNTGQKFVNIGILIESTKELNLDSPLFIRDFTYTAADILVQDERKNNLTIEQNFNPSFIGGIQKLRIYDKALLSSEVLHNIYWETKNNPYEIIVVSKGGRIIYS
jgi:hypothetical protein